MPVMRRIVNVSTNRSVTTVPNDLANETLSYFANTPQRLTSPIRGTTRLAAYEMKIAFTQSLFFGKASNGSSVCLHRHPRKTCANTPNTNEKSIHHQFVPCNNTSPAFVKSKSRYTQNKIKPPKTTGNISFSVFFNSFFILNSSLAALAYHLFLISGTFFI